MSEADAPGGEAAPDIDMREAIVEMTLASVRRFFDPTATRASVVSDPAHREAFIATLRDCRPLPVVRAIEADLRAGRL